MKQFGTFFGLAFSALLPLINPVGDALVFLGLVGAAPPEVYRTLARKIAINTIVFMMVIHVSLTAGPGCIVVMVTLSAHASVGGVLSAAEAHAGIVAAVMLLSAAVYICYGRAPAITARVRPETAHGILRVIAFVLLCIGVQVTWNGLATLLKAAK